MRWKLWTAPILAMGLLPLHADDAKPDSKGKPVTRMIENTFRNWRFEELPPAVQKTAYGVYPNQKINDIDREDRNGQTVWEIEFDGGDADDIEIHVDNDGKLLDLDDKGKKRPQPKPAVATSPARASDHKTDFEKAPTKRVAKNWDKLPAAVQVASERFGGKDALRDIDHEKREGQEVWELEFERAGQNIELHFTTDGRVLEHIDSKEPRKEK